MTDTARRPEPEIRAIEEAEHAAFARVIQLGFGEGPDETSVHEERKLLELDRTLAAFAGDEVVASAAAYTFEMTVPGRSVATAGVTWVSVVPTHRRRGLLRRLMRRQLDDVHEAGREPVAALWASEQPIYGRFGYGTASSTYELTVPRSSRALRPVPGVDDVVVRLVEPEEHLDRTLHVYDHDRARRPGMVAMHGPWAPSRLVLPLHLRSGGSPLRTVVAEDADGSVRGYARFLTRPGDDFGAATTLVRELHAVDPAAYAALLRLLLDLDLTARATFVLRPPDDPLFSLLVDARSARPRWGDGLQVRLVDVPAALAARKYATPVDVVLDVGDAFCPWNAGRWHLSGDPTGASCERTDRDADLRLDVRELGGSYLGGPTLAAAWAAGLVQEETPGAVAALSLAMRHDPAPWSPFIF